MAYEATDAKPQTAPELHLPDNVAPGYPTLPPHGSPQRKKLFAILGPGLITGASDDDPSGIATYSQAGAFAVYGMLWTALFSLPFMAAIQEISARIGRVTGRGLASNIRQHYSAWLLYPIVLLLLIANVINLGADIGAMGEAMNLLVGGPAVVYAAAFATISLLLQMFVPFARYTQYLKWLSISLLIYIGTAFFGHVHWKQVLIGTVVPKLPLDAKHIGLFIAVIGTTISPYLFFWQAALESEEVKQAPGEKPLKKAPEQAREQLERIRLDTYIGMFLSNAIAFFIMLTAAVTIGTAHGGGYEIGTAREAAEGLRTALGGQTALGKIGFWLFSVGIIGTGLLAIPTLAGSAAYAVGNAMKWRTGLEYKPHRAKGFYLVLVIATFLGLLMNLIKAIDPMKALVYSAVLNGIVAVPVMVIVMLMSSNPAVMGKFTRIGRTLKIMGWLATLIMLLATVGLFLTWGK